MKRIFSILALSSVFLFSALQVQARPSPVASSLAPNSITVGSASQTLTIGGSNFQSSDQFTVYFKAANKPVTYISDTKISVVLSDSDLSEVGAFPVKVQWKNDAGTEVVISPVEFNLNITAASATVSSVTITDMTPNSVVKGAESVSLKINGEGLGTVPVEVSFDGLVAPEMTVLAPNTIQVKIPGSSLATVRSAPVKVVANPSTSPVYKNFEFNITEADVRSNTAGGPVAGPTPGASPGADSTCSLNLLSQSGNAWFLLVALFGQMTLLLSLRKK